MFTAHTSSKKHVGTTENESVILCSVPLSPNPFFLNLNLLALELFFLILAHPVYKMWIIQELNTLELWNKLDF